jgi:hypothetical protein
LFICLWGFDYAFSCAPATARFLCGLVQKAKSLRTLSACKRENRRLGALPVLTAQKTESVSPSLSLAQQFAAAIIAAEFDEDEKQVFWLRSLSTRLALPHSYAVAS